MVISGCSSMSKDECEFANWQAMGYQYGVRGENASAFQKYQNECASHRVKADYQAFKKGHQEGLNNYCSYERGNEKGKSGHVYNAQCPGSQYPKYSQGYSDGINRYCSYERGLETGKTGSKYNATCPGTKYPKFAQGYNDGINRYCSYERGVETGEKGSKYNTTCPSTKYPKFVQGFNDGMNRYCSYENGLQTGEKGSKHNATCPSTKYPKFVQGYNNGMKRYCSYERGFRIGAEGKVSPANCSHNKFSAYKKGYVAGQVQLNTINKINSLKNQLTSLGKQLQREQLLLDRAIEINLNKNSTEKQRRKSLTDIQLHRANISELEHENIELKSEILYLEAQLHERNG